MVQKQQRQVNVLQPLSIIFKHKSTHMQQPASHQSFNAFITLHAHTLDKPCNQAEKLLIV